MKEVFEYCPQCTTKTISYSVSSFQRTITQTIYHEMTGKEIFPKHILWQTERHNRG